MDAYVADLQQIVIQSSVKYGIFIHTKQLYHEYSIILKMI